MVTRQCSIKKRFLSLRPIAYLKAWLLVATPDVMSENIKI